ncbi:hypothetical protein F0726_02393 [Acidithiobacillus caldus]|nr:hypothetical protein F0726_02393 [Acidithiobacillus caldus]
MDLSAPQRDRIPQKAFDRLRLVRQANGLRRR